MISRRDKKKFENIFKRLKLKGDNLIVQMRKRAIDYKPEIKLLESLEFVLTPGERVWYNNGCFARDLVGIDCMKPQEYCEYIIIALAEMKGLIFYKASYGKENTTALNEAYSDYENEYSELLTMIISTYMCPKVMI